MKGRLWIRLILKNSILKIKEKKKENHKMPKNYN